MVEGNPQVILFDVGSAAYKMNEFKQELYDSAGIGGPHGDVEVNDVTIFGFMVAQFLADFRVIYRVFHFYLTIFFSPKVRAESYSDLPPRISAHFHEWMSGIGLIMSRLWKTDIATLFTTHATQLGRQELNIYYLYFSLKSQNVN